MHANFLLHTDKTIDDALKVSTFSSGFIYHENISLNKNILKKYDVILGNPPWEKIRFEEKKFYALYDSSIANNHFKSSRLREIKETNKDNAILGAFTSEFVLEIEKSKNNIKNNPFFELTNHGKLNTYSLFDQRCIEFKNT